MNFYKSIASTFVSKVLVSVLGLLVVILVSRELGAEGRGAIGLMMSGVALLQLFCDFGSNSSIINLSYTHSQRNLWLSALIWVGCTCVGSYLIIFFIKGVHYIYLIPPLAFLYSVVNTHCLLLMGNRRVNRRNIVLLLVPVGLCSGFYLLFRATPLGMSAYPVALFIALMISVVISYALISDRLEPAEPFAFEKIILRQGFWVQGGQAIQFLNYRINFFLIAIILNDSALGIYNNAIILVESIWILGHSMGQMQHMRILNTEDEKEHLTLSNRVILVNFGGSLLLMGVLMLLPSSFWVFLFSSDFKDIGQLFIYLGPGVLCFSISNIINHFLHARNAFKSIALANLAGLIVGVSCSLYMIPSMGLKGACLAWSDGLFCSMLVYLFVYKRYFRNS